MVQWVQIHLGTFGDHCALSVMLITEYEAPAKFAKYIWPNIFL